MNVSGIYKLKIATPDPTQHTFFRDAGMQLTIGNQSQQWNTLNGSSVELIESSNSGLLCVEWAADCDHRFVDSTGIEHVFRSDVQFDAVPDTDTKTNTFSVKQRINRPISIKDTQAPCAIAHVAIFTADIHKSCQEFENLGFVISDMITDRAIFLRSRTENPHHQILLSQSDTNTGLHHVALAVSDVYSVITKGLAMAANGWNTLIGPGRHVISSSTHWYFNTGLGAFEFTCDEDFLTADWQYNVYDPLDVVVNEWAIEGGINPQTRTQHSVTPQAKFINQRMKSNNDGLNNDHNK
jgi:hypothetical protein